MIFNMVGGGGGSGATLVVSSPANVSVTVSKDDKSYTKNSGSLGSATFKGLATGTWTVTISGNGQTATKTIGITADYAITIAFFSATINITYPATSTCVVTNSGGQTVASDTNTGSSTKTWTATVGATGTYTVTAAATDGSGKSKSQSVNITADGQSESVTLSYVLVLFDNGKWNPVTGGFTGTIANGRLSCSASASGSGTNWVDGSASAKAKSMIDVTNYAKCTFIGVSFTHGDGGGLVTASGNVFCGGATGSGTGAVALDISKISGEVSIGIKCSISTPNVATATISCSKIYLE